MSAITIIHGKKNTIIHEQPIFSSNKKHKCHFSLQICIKCQFSQNIFIGLDFSIRNLRVGKSSEQKNAPKQKNSVGELFPHIFSIIRSYLFSFCFRLLPFQTVRNRQSFPCKIKNSFPYGIELGRYPSRSVGSGCCPTPWPWRLSRTDKHLPLAQGIPRHSIGFHS